MCGIAGLWHARGGRSLNARRLGSMLRRLDHRGPDSAGTAVGDSFAIGQTRLAIVDLEGGEQPIWDSEGTSFIVGNNEIYNAVELRRDLQSKGHQFQTRSDTEVLLHGWKEWGEALFGKLNGMFAFAIVDQNRDECVLARDHLGIKPLHLANYQGGVVFASEVKSLWSLPDFQKKPNWDSIHLFMNYRYVPDESTLFEGVRRLAPGTFVRFQGQAVTEKSFYEISPEVDSSLTYQDAEERLDGALERAIDRHLVSDVEVGAYLSGGVDSSLVSTLAQRKSRRLKTFCLGFGEPSDENDDAQNVAKHLQTDHESFYVSDDILGRYKDVIWQVEEPKINCLQGFLLAERASQKLKVILSGLGGDELFAGYTNNDFLYPLRFINGSEESTKTLSSLQKLIPSHRFANVFRAGELLLNSRDPVAYYSILRNSFDHNPHLLQEIYASPKKRWQGMSIEVLRKYYRQSNSTLNSLLALEARTKLVNDFLLTEDRVSMAHCLEVRVPLLDRELVDLSFSLPHHFKYQLRNKKRILKSLSQGWLTDSVLQKKKWGFSFNPHLFFRKRLRDFASSVLTRDRVNSIGLFRWEWIDSVLNARPTPHMRWHYFNLWAMTGFHLWFDLFFEGEGHARLD